MTYVKTVSRNEDWVRQNSELGELNSTVDVAVYADYRAIYFRKQAWLWMQGDIHRAKQKEKERLVTKERTSPGVSRILSTLDDMKINDAMLDDNFNETHFDNRYGDVVVDQEVYVCTCCFLC